MSKSPGEFGRLLTKAIRIAQAQNPHKTIGGIQLELANVVGYSQDTLRKWSQGHLPDDENINGTVEKLARKLAELHGWQDRQHLEEFLHSADYPPLAGLSNELFPPETRMLLPPLKLSRLPLMDAPDFSTQPQDSEAWSEAPDVSIFYGRDKELATLVHWLVTDRCRLIAVLGIVGIGKTALATKLAERVKAEFKHFIWLSLGNAPPFDDILAQCLQHLLGQREFEWPKSTDKGVSLLITNLQKFRVLLVLDDYQAILRSKDRAGHYQEGYEQYGELLEQIGQTRHQSCLVLTSQEKPKEFVPLRGETSPIRSLQLRGLGPTEVRALLQDKGVHGSDEALANLVLRYSGNPLAIKLVAETIGENYEGDLDCFPQEGWVFDGVRDLIDSQFSRLPKKERDVVYWLAIERKPVSGQELAQNSVHPMLPEDLLEVLSSLQRRSVIEKSPAGYTLPTLLMDFVTARFVRQICREIMTEKPALFNSHALMKAQAKDYVRDVQTRLILKPIVQKLGDDLGGEKGVLDKLTLLLASLRQAQPPLSGYAGGNTLNLLAQLKLGLRKVRDFSRLTLWQAYLPEVDLRGVSFEGADLRNSVFAETFGNIVSVAISPDGELLAAGTSDHELRLWDAAGNQIFLWKDSDWIRAIAFHPKYSHLLASGSCGDYHLRLWDVQKGEEPLAILKGHTHPVRSVAFNPHYDGLLASGSDDGTIRLWNVDTQECLLVLKRHSSKVSSIAFSSDGLILASGSEDRTIGLWDIQTGELLKFLSGHTGRIFAVAFSPTDPILISGSEDGRIGLWNAQTGELLKFLSGHAGPVNTVAFSPDGRLLASGSDDQELRLWEAQSGEFLNISLKHTKSIWSVAFSIKNQLASGADDQTLHLWEKINHTWQCFKILKGYDKSVFSLAIAHNRQLLASGGGDQVVRLWDIGRTERPNPVELGRHTKRVKSVAFSPDDRFLASGSDDGAIALWRIEPDLRPVEPHWLDHRTPVNSVAFHPAGNLLASGSSDHIIRLWKINEKKIYTELKDHEGLVRSVVFNPQGDLLASGSDDKTIRIWDIEIGQCLKTLVGHDSWVRKVVFSPDGRILASGSQDKTIRLWDVISGECLSILPGHQARIRTVAFSPDGRLLASGSDDQTLRLWHADNGQCFKVLPGHHSFIRAVDFSPDGRRLISCDDDGAIKLWDGETYECIETLEPPLPYQGMNITAITGLTEVQKEKLKILGAVEHSR